MKSGIFEILTSIFISVIVTLFVVGGEHFICTIIGIPFADFSIVMRYTMLGSFCAIYGTYSRGKHLDSKKKEKD